MILPGSPNALEQAQLRTMLIEERTRLRDLLSRLENLGDAVEPEQPEDVGLAEQAARMINEIDLALDRMEQGTYGMCEGCGRSISIERLEAIPSASRCTDCHAGIERL